MAREARHLHADALIKAIYEASSLLPKPIDRVVVKGSVITVEGGGRRVTFRELISHTGDPRTGAPFAGGTSGDAIVVQGKDGVTSSAAGPWGFLRSLFSGVR